MEEATIMLLVASCNQAIYTYDVVKSMRLYFIKVFSISLNDVLNVQKVIGIVIEYDVDSWLG